MNQNDPVVMVSIEDTELLDGRTIYPVYCWRHVSDCFELDTFTDECEAMRKALRVRVPVVRWMNHNKRDEFIEMCEKRHQAQQIIDHLQSDNHRLEQYIKQSKVC